MVVDHYETLGVARGASPDEIKRAYRNLARRLHPDANRDDPAASERFKEVTRAYEVLSDPQKRQRYDAFGDERARVGGDFTDSGIAGVARFAEWTIQARGNASWFSSICTRSFL